MKIRIILFFLLMAGMVSCRFEHEVIDETYPDGTTKRLCVYLGKGENRELIRETTFYPNKRRQMEGAYKDQKREGKWTYWYEDGTLWSEGMYLRGKSDGKRTTYFENGKVRYEGMYKNDMRVGKWQFFDENGRLLKEVDYSAPASK
jgi:antitoxin component YwqK of YwqJK toxin-antitoxin module